MKFWVLGLVGLAIVLAASYFLFFRQDTRMTTVSCTELIPTPRVIALGDSLVAGYGAPKGQDFVSVLGSLSGVRIDNEGISGNTSAQVLLRTDSVIAKKPDIVILLVGGNDALQQVAQAETEKDIIEIVEKLQKAGAQVVLVGVLGGLPVDPYKSMFERIASTYKTEYVPNILAGLIGNDSFMSDPVHPNAAGYAKVASKILPGLERACSSRAS